MPEPAETLPPDAERERKKSGLPFFFLRLKERIQGLFGKGDFREGLKRTMSAPTAVALRELPQWKPRAVITASWLLGEIWRQKIPFAIIAGLLFWLGVRYDSPTQVASNLHRWLPGASTWEPSSRARDRIWEKHGAQAGPVASGPSAPAAEEGPEGSGKPVSTRFVRSASLQNSPATEMARTLMVLFAGGNSLSAAFLGDGTQTFASDGSPTFAGDDKLKGDKKWDAAIAAAVGAYTAPPHNKQPQAPPPGGDESSNPVGEQMAAAMSGDGADLQKKLALYAQNETWKLEKATTHEETLPPLDGDAMKNSRALQQLWVTRTYTQFALYCGGDCRVEKRMYNNRATFYGEKN